MAVIQSAKKKQQSRLSGTQGIMIASALLLAGLIGIYLEFGRSDGRSDAIDRSQVRTFIDAENGQVFDVRLKPGMTYPVTSPFTGRATGLEGELCYWTADGSIKATPDHVLLNFMRMPPVRGATFCPFCHRLVVERNPAPDPGSTPPPTESEYRASPATYASLFHRR
jgi:hypothetical protein